MSKIICRFNKSLAILNGFIFCFNSVSIGQEIAKPNVLFIFTDQQRFDPLSIAGNQVLINYKISK